MSSAISVQLTPGYLLADDEIFTPAIARAIARPTVNLVGTFGTASIADGSVTTAKLADGALSSDATGRGKVADGFVTNAKLATMATATIKGRATAGTGAAEDLTPAQVRTLLGRYVSVATVIPATGTTAVFAHLLASMPWSYRVTLLCVTNDANTGYLTTDPEIDIIGAQTSLEQVAFSVQADATNITVLRNSNSALYLLKKSNGQITQATAVANFQLKVYAAL